MSKTTRVLVYGGTGAQGRPIVERLIADGFAVRVATRSTDDRAGLPSGVETATADFDVADSLLAANRSCQKVVLLLPLIFDVPQAERWTANAVAAAKQAGVDLLVFDASAPAPPEICGVPAIDIRVRAEAIVRGGDVPAIVLRPTIYLDNLTAPWSVPAIAANHVVAYPLPSQVKVSWTTWDNVAGFVSAALRRPDLSGGTYDIGGAEALDGPALAAAFSRALGVEHDYAEIPLAGFEQGLNAAFGAPVGTEIARLYRWFAGAGRDRIAADVSVAAETFDVSPEPVLDWIERHDWTQQKLAS